MARTNIVNGELWNSKETRFVLDLLDLFYQGKGIIERAIDCYKGEKNSHPLSELIRIFFFFWRIIALHCCVNFCGVTM